MDQKAVIKMVVVIVSIALMFILFPFFAFGQSDTVDNPVVKGIVDQLAPLSLVSLPVENFIWIGFLIVLIIFAVYSVILLYHWIRYAFSSLITWPALVIYFGVSFVLISVMLFSALSFA